MENLSLDEDQVAKCKEAFKLFDINNNKKITPKNMKKILEDMGYYPKEEELYNMIYEVNENGIDYITEEDFILIIDKQKKIQDNKLDKEIYGAYLALGGDPDKTKCIDINLIKHIILDEFKMTINLDSLIKEMDKDNSSKIEYDELKHLLSN